MLLLYINRAKACNTKRLRLRQLEDSRGQAVLRRNTSRFLE